jgi:NAD(P)H dehydrogenase (quinone)
MRIVVTGATGHLGRLVIEGLLEQVPADQITAVVRNPDKAAGIAARGVRIAVADYTSPDTFDGLFAAGDKVLLISSSEPVGYRVDQHRVVVDAARAAGVALLAYTSALGSLTAALADDHRDTEAEIVASGVPYTLLRNGWYHENYTEQLAPVLEYHAVTQAAGEGRVASASRADYAAAAVAVLTGEGHENTTYELSGDTAWSFAEYAAALSEQTGTDIAYHPVSVEEYTAILTGQAGLPAGLVAILAGVEVSIGRGELAGTSGDLARLTGRPTTPLADAIAAALQPGTGSTQTPVPLGA